MSPSKRRPRSSASGGAPPDPLTVGSGAEGVPDNFEYVDELHARIVPVLKDRVSKMVDEAVQDPDSEANQLVRILLLNQVANMHPSKYQDDPKLTVTEERHRGIENERRNEYTKHMVKLLEGRAKKLEEDIKMARARVEELQQKVKQGQYRLAEAERLAQNARAAVEQGQPLDPMAVYNKIAEIIGLQYPGQETAGGGTRSN